VTTNILVKGLCKIKNHVECAPIAVHNNYEYYVEMHKLSIESYKKNLQGDWILKELDIEQDNIQEYFKNLLIFIKNVWHEFYPCNILYADADTLCIKPLSIFGQFDDFRLFSEDDPIIENSYINGGIKYYPAELSKEFWDQIDFIIDNWDNDMWIYEQIAQASLMFRYSKFDSDKKQDWVVRQIGFNHQRLISEIALDNIKSIKQAILHFHSSQYPLYRLEAMQFIWKNLQ
jgi:hypothetical protein